MVNNTWEEGRKITPQKSHPVQSCVLLSIIFLILKKRNPFASTRSHSWQFSQCTQNTKWSTTWKSNLSKQLPRVHSATSRNLILSVLLMAEPSTHLDPGKVTRNKWQKYSATARSTACGVPGGISFQKFVWAKAVRKWSQKKEQELFCVPILFIGAHVHYKGFLIFYAVTSHVSPGISLFLVLLTRQKDIKSMKDWRHLAI